MVDATLAQGNQLLTLILQADDPKRFAQNLISNWGAVQVIGRGEIDQATFQAAIKEVVNPFATEKKPATLTYPRNWKPTSVGDQLKVLQGLYPDLDGSHVLAIAEGISIPKAADGLFVVPKPSSVAAKQGIDDPFGRGYGQLLETIILAHLANQRAFSNWRAGELTPDRVRMRESAVNAIHKLEEETPGDFLVISAQTGKKWGGYSPRNARWEMERGEEEFPLPAWCVGHIILTNPKRLEKYEHLCIDCPGDEYRFGADEGFGSCFDFDFVDGKLHFSSRWTDYVYDYFGSASAVLR